MSASIECDLKICSGVFAAAFVRDLAHRPDWILDDVIISRRIPRGVRGYSSAGKIYVSAALSADDQLRIIAHEWTHREAQSSRFEWLNRFVGPWHRRQFHERLAKAVAASVSDAVSRRFAGS